MEKKNTPAPPAYTTLLLDADGTLLDFDEAERQGVSAVLRTYGIEPSPDLIHRYHEINLYFWKAFERGDIPKNAIFERRYPTFFSELGRQIDTDQVEKLYRHHLDACAVLLPGAEEICAWLRDRYDLYIITNGVASTQHLRLEMSGLCPYFKDIFISEEIGGQKPSRLYFDRCLARIPEKDRSRMLVIGDSLSSDIQGGKNAGIDTCWFNPGKKPRANGPEPDYEIHELKELKGFL